MRRMVILVICVLTLVIIILVIHDHSNIPCNVAEINVRGLLATYSDPEISAGEETSSEDIREKIDQIEGESDIRSILAVVDSPGGSAVASKEIMSVLENTSKYVVAVVRESATSGAYWAILGADKIFASSNSRIGSIGVTKSYLSNVRKNDKDGLDFIELNTGRFKDSLDPNKKLSSQEIAYVKEGLQTVFNNFVEDVSNKRHIEISRVKQLADGSVYYGNKAMEYGLIDKIGNYFDAIADIESYIGKPITICKY